ncbi:MAG: aminotransferase class I/II-fold pyridoxal phosphate-dependent enzyme [Bacillota bacterium]|jgi:arginine decarboxylase
MNGINQKSAPLVEKMAEYLKEGYQPFHMPGHKGSFEILKKWRNLLGEGVFFWDLTEVEGLDDIHHPTGPILEAQRLAADLLGAYKAFFLINGVTAGIHGLIMALSGSGDKVIMPRHAHRSVYEGIILSGATPVYLKPEVDVEWGIPTGIGTDRVEAALNRHPEAKCLVMVHPTYQGLTSDLYAIGHLARAKGIPLVVDEAHGAHFKFSPRFPLPALQCGASAVVQGWHKTMGSFTQTGILLVQDNITGLEDYLSLIQSTSPSYLLMASLDAARQEWAENGGKLAEKTLDLAWDFRNKVTQLEGVLCLDRENINSSVLTGWDATKILLNARNLGLNGFELAQELRRKYRIQPEMASWEGVLLMVTIGDTKERMDYLFDSLKDLVSRFSVGMKKLPKVCYDYEQPEMALLPKDAMKYPKKTVDIKKAEGCVSGEFICPYPPGIPLIVPGEIITREIIKKVLEIKTNGGHIQGPKDLSVNTLRVID